jgi:hypothetical protein
MLVCETLIMKQVLIQTVTHVSCDASGISNQYQKPCFLISKELRESPGKQEQHAEEQQEYQMQPAILSGDKVSNE